MFHFFCFRFAFFLFQLRKKLEHQEEFNDNNKKMRLSFHSNTNNFFFSNDK